MQVRQFPDLEFRKLNKLVYDYCKGNPNVREFYNLNPQFHELAAEASNRIFPATHYARLSEVLREQYSNNQRIQEVDENIAAFSNGSAITVCTGHQLCLLGGPAYLIYKILSTIKLAENVQREVANKKVVPLFWLAGEDHDREEMNHTFINESRLEWKTDQTGAVGRYAMDGFEHVLNEWIDSIEDEQLRNSMLEMWSRALHEDSWAGLTKSWIHDCFGEWGLVVLNPDNAVLKQLFSSIIKKELLQGVTHKCVASTNNLLAERGYHAQVNPREINLFYLSNQARVRIERSDRGWYTVDDRFAWNETELLLELENHPENFSPNVLLRPLYQETILPNIAYVGGPGELSYWLQLKGLFAELDKPMPALILRDSAIIISPTSGRRLKKLGLEVHDLLRNKQEVIANLVGAKPDFSEEKNEIARSYERLANRMAAIDSTLKASAMAEANRVLSGIDQLQAKTWKALKIKEEQKLSSLDKVWEEIFPMSTWQERSKNMLKESMSNDKEIARNLLREFQAPVSTLVIIEL